MLVAQGELPRPSRRFAPAWTSASASPSRTPATLQWQRDLSVSHNKIGDVLVAQGELPRPSRRFAPAWTSPGASPSRTPGRRAVAARSLPSVYNKIGDVLVAQGELPQAEQAFRAGMDIAKRLAEQDPGNAQWQRDLSVSHERIGDVLVAQGELTQAEQAFRAGMDIPGASPSRTVARPAAETTRTNGYDAAARAG